MRNSDWQLGQHLQRRAHAVHGALAATEHHLPLPSPRPARRHLHPMEPHCRRLHHKFVLQRAGEISVQSLKFTFMCDYPHRKADHGRRHSQGRLKLQHCGPARHSRRRVSVRGDRSNIIPRLPQHPPPPNSPRRYVSVDIPDQLGFSPLMNASQRGFTSIVEELLQRGADVNYTNSSGKSRFEGWGRGRGGGWSEQLLNAWVWLQPHAGELRRARVYCGDSAASQC